MNLQQVRRLGQALATGVAIVSLSEGCTPPERPTCLSVGDVATNLPAFENSQIILTGVPTSAHVEESAARAENTKSTWLVYNLIDPSSKASLTVYRHLHVGYPSPEDYSAWTNLQFNSNFQYPDGRVVMEVRVGKSTEPLVMIEPLVPLRKIER